MGLATCLCFWAPYGISWLDEGAETRDPARLIGLNIPGRRGFGFSFFLRGPILYFGCVPPWDIVQEDKMNPCFVPRVEPCDMPVYLGTSMLMITG